VPPRFLTSALACGSAEPERDAAPGETFRASSSQVDGGSTKESNEALSRATIGLSLSETSAERIAGRYVSSVTQGVGLDFVSSKKGEKIVLSLADLKGRELVHMEGSPKEGVFLRHGALTLRVAPAVVESAAAAAKNLGDGPPRPELSPTGRLPNGDVVVEGDVATFAQFEKLPELALLPELSRALGDSGLAGHKVPAALALHAFAMSFASNSPALAPAGISGDKVGNGESVSSAAPSFICTPGDVECCESHPNDPGCIPDPDPPPPTDVCAGREPRGSSCIGLCGPGCHCWPSICGDCCYHPGCAQHDRWCGRCGWLHPHDCLLCYGPTALIGILGC